MITYYLINSNNAMTDIDIINFFIDKKNNKFYEAKLNKKYLANKAILYKNYLDNRYKEPFDKYSEVIARIYYNIDIKPCCKVCGKPLKFKSLKQPYGKWCSNKCQLKDPEFIAWRTSITDYNIITIKSKQTCLEKYGNSNYKNLEKAKQTCLEKYGVIHAMKNNNIKNKLKQTCLERYGVENVYQSEVIKDKCKNTKLIRYNDPKYRNQDKIKQTCLERYGVENYLQTNNDNIKRGSKENLEKVKQTCLEKYGVEYFFQSEEWKIANKRTCLEKYGVSSYSATDEGKLKMYNTKKINNTFNTSSIEKKLIEYFIKNNIDFKTQYKSELYPYMCDFYFPNTNTYVEIQGNWTHGGKPFDINDEHDIEKLELWETKNTNYYKVAIKVWTKSDVEKRNLAKANNINFFEIFSVDFDYIILQLKNNNII